MEPTQEQQKSTQTVIENKVTVIQACAGAGKTSTLVMIAKAYPERGLYLAFNKSAAVEASEKFPSHITCKTTHAIAYAKFGSNLRDKLSRPVGKYVNVAGTGSEIARFFKIAPLFNKGHVVSSASHIGLLIKMTVASFEQSADEEIKKDHLPLFELKEIRDTHSVSTHELEREILAHAKKLWALRIDITSPVLATHDTYLKMFQLSKPVLGYSIIYLDESQDTTDCVFDIIKNQVNSKLVFVGDEYQNIYSWRGSKNVMSLVENAAHCTLSKSFRYGAAVADIAVLVLNGAMNVQGLETINSVVGYSKIVDRTKPYTVLCRSNSMLVTLAIADINAGKKVSMEIDVRDLVMMMQSAEALFKGDNKNVKHEKLLAFNDWNELKEEGKEIREFQRIADIVEDEKNFSSIMNALQNHRNPQLPDVTYTTCHKAKGREYHQVILANDFPSNFNANGDWVGLHPSERNLLYVGATRAITNLEYNSTISELINDKKANTQLNFEKFINDLESDIVKD